jgi:hypothetical protein
MADKVRQLTNVQTQPSIHVGAPTQWAYQRWLTGTLIKTAVDSYKYSIEGIRERMQGSLHLQLFHNTAAF